MTYIPHTQRDIREMLAQIGKKDIEDLFAEIPQQLRMQGGYDIPESLTELEIVRCLGALAQKNVDSERASCFLGAGMYDHFIPVLVDYLAGRSEFATSYTPYQAEASQGNLQTIFEYQTAICELTGLDIANASLYDGASAVAEAILMAHAFHRRKRNRVLLASTIHPEYREVAETCLQYLDLQVDVIPEREGLLDSQALAALIDENVFCVVMQFPNFFGLLEDAAEISRIVHQHPISLVSIANVVSLGVLSCPGEYGADIAVGEGQPLGVPMAYGGPSFGFMAAKQEYLRNIPGRIVGKTVDGQENTGYVLTLQTREQHIRREKATSNICTNQALMALRGLIYLTSLGREGFRELAVQCLQKAHYLAGEIDKLASFKLRYAAPFFHEFVVECPVEAEQLLTVLERQGIYAGIPLSRWFPERKNELLVAVTESRNKNEMDNYIAALQNV